MKSAAPFQIEIQLRLIQNQNQLREHMAEATKTPKFEVNYCTS